ncbi:MAG: hypothetical protein HYY06_15130 [Deltaproteobacteria bacterium]|nr:hypothetical protein [Deltaproteobacteria bacterium]
MISSIRVASLAAALLAPGAALAEDTIFFGAHPIHPAVGGGFCEADGAHVHDYAAVDPSAFAHRDGLWIFVGDPTAWGFGGAVYPFDGAHELPEPIGGGICAIVAVHYHLFPPPSGPGATVVYPFFIPILVPIQPGWGAPQAPIAPRAPFPYPRPPVVRRPPPTTPPPVLPGHHGGIGRRGHATPRPPATGRPAFPVAPPPPSRRMDRRPR